MKPAGIDADVHGPVPVDLSLRRGGARTLGAARASDFVALTKPRLNTLVVATSAAGYYLAGGSGAAHLAAAALGTALVAGGAAALNQVYERETDALMLRTRRRPLPDGRLQIPEATAFGALLSVAGVALLAVTCNALSAFLAVATLATYLVVYTPMKLRTPRATIVGAVPGALPAVIGWAAASGRASVGGWVLFAIVFLWQMPHFYAIAWMYRDDYRRAGFPLLPIVEPDGRSTGRQALAYAAVLIPVSLLPTLVGIAGWIYFAGALVLGAALFVAAARFAWDRTVSSARLLFLGSITYLPLIWGLMILDYGGRP
jgi:heme o synthase